MIIYNEFGIKIYATGKCASGENQDGTKAVGYQFACEYDGKKRFYSICLQFNSLDHISDDEKENVISAFLKVVHRDRAIS